MTDDTRDRVRRVLEDAEERSASLDSDGANAAEAFGDVPGRANKLVSNADPAELLEAAGSDTVPEGDPPETIAEAIARSDADTLVELRKLLVLSRMAEKDDDALAEHAETFRRLSREDDDDAESDGAEKPGGDGDAEEAAGEPSTDEAEAEAKAKAETETEGEASDSEAEADDQGRVREALLGEVEGFRERIQTARAQLEDDESESESEGDESEGDASEVEDDESEDDGAEPEDSGGTRGPSGSGGTMFSTIPSRDRADMRGPDRFSTVRRK